MQFAFRTKTGPNHPFGNRDSLRRFVADDIKLYFSPVMAVTREFSRCLGGNRHTVGAGAVFYLVLLSCLIASFVITAFLFDDLQASLLWAWHLAFTG